MTELFRGYPAGPLRGAGERHGAGLPPLRPGRDGDGQAAGGPPALRRLPGGTPSRGRVGDPFGGQTFERPWFGDTMAQAKLKADVAFEMFRILGVPFFCFHDADIRPEGADFAENTRNLEEIVDYLGQKMEAGGPRLLWGTANMFSHRRWMAGAATNPDPEVFAFAAATVKSCLDATHQLGGAELRPVGRARGLRDAAQHRPEARAAAGRAVPADGRGLQAQHRLRGDDPDRAEAAGAHQAPVRLRRGDALRVPEGVRAGGRGEAEHRAGARDPRRAQLRARAGAGGGAGDPRLDRHEPQRLPVGLGHRPVPQQRARGGAGLLRDPEGGRLHDRRHQLRRQAAAAVAGSGGPDRRPCRRRWTSAPAG